MISSILTRNSIFNIYFFYFIINYISYFSITINKINKFFSIFIIYTKFKMNNFIITWCILTSFIYWTTTRRSLLPIRRVRSEKRSGISLTSISCAAERYCGLWTVCDSVTRCYIAKGILPSWNMRSGSRTCCSDTVYASIRPWCKMCSA